MKLTYALSLILILSSRITAKNLIRDCSNKVQPNDFIDSKFITDNERSLGQKIKLKCNETLKQEITYFLDCEGNQLIGMKKEVIFVLPVQPTELTLQQYLYNEFLLVQNNDATLVRVVESSGEVISLAISQSIASKIESAPKSLNSIWFLKCHAITSMRHLSECQAGAFVDQDGSCALCSEVDLRKYKNSCVETCPSGAIFNSSSNTCIDCTKYIYNNQCTDICPSNTYIKNRECTECPSGEFISESQCVKECDSDQMVNFSFLKCHRYSIGCESDSCLNGVCSNSPHKYYNINWRCECEASYFGSLCQNHIEYIDDANIRPVILAFPEGIPLTDFQMNFLIEYFEMLLVVKDYSLEYNIAMKIHNLLQGYLNLIDYPEHFIRLFDLTLYVNGQMKTVPNESLLDDFKRFMEKTSIHYKANNLDLKVEFLGQNFSLSIGYENLKFKKCLDTVREKIGETLIYQNIIFNDYFFDYTPDLYDVTYFDNPHAVFSIFDGKQRLPASRYCGPELFDISFRRHLNSKVDMGLIQSFKNDGINLFDPDDKFFNSKCNYKRTDNLDVTIKIRRSQYFNDPSFLCSEINTMFCKIEEIYGDNSVKCDCQGITPENKETKLPRLKSYLKNNLMLIKCYDSFLEVTN